jgi:hypothetical protein
MSIDPSLWGKSFWSTLHWTAAAYPTNPTTEDKVAYATFFETLRYVLPCEDCRQHYQTLLDQNPVQPFLISGKELRQWVVSLHNTVNSKTDRKDRWSLEQVDAVFPPADESDSTAPKHANAALPPATNKSIPPKPPQRSTAIVQSRRIVQSAASQSMGRIIRPVSVTLVRKSLPQTVQRSSASAATVQIAVKKKNCNCNAKKK